MSTFAEARRGYDEGLREFMINMFNHTAAGLAVSGLVAYVTFASGLWLALAPMMWIIAFAPLAMILFYSFAGQNWSVSGLTNFYYAFTAVMGISLSTIFVVYDIASIIQVFFITSATFAGASLYGYTTKKDLTSMGTFLMIGLIGIIIASVVNLFLASSAVAFAVSIIGVIVFTGLTAYDIQMAKQIYLNHGANPRYGIQFAISLYLNFINLFQMLLHLLGNRE